jgi:hypothetical protein
MTPLERRYGRLLSLYPKDYRAERGEEIMSTVLGTSQLDQLWPHPKEAIPLIGHALRMRLGLAESQPIGRLLVVIGPAQLILASLMSMMSFLGAEWNPWWGRHVLPGGQVGPFQTTGFIAYLSWTAAGLALLSKNPKVTRRLVVLSMAITALLVPFSRALALDRPSLNLLAFLFVLGIPILVSSPQSIKGSVSDRLQKVLIAMSLLVAIAIALALLPVWDGSTVHQFSRGSYGLSPSLLYYQTDLVLVAAWLFWIDAAAIAASATLFSVGRRLLAGSVALSGLPLLVLWFGFRYLSFGFRYNESTVHLLVGVVLVASSLVLVCLSMLFPKDEAMERAG